MKSIFLVCMMILLFSMSNVFAETFEGSDDDNYLFLQISNDKAFGLLRTGGDIISIQSDIKYYNNGNFRTSAFDNRVILFGTPNDDLIDITIFNLEKRQKISLVIQKFDTSISYEKTVQKELTVLEKFEQAQNQTGMGNIHAQKQLEKLEEEKKRVEQLANKTVIPRSEYVESKEKEIKILDEIMERFPYYREFFFDIRIVDPTINGIGNDYWNDIGFINDVEVVSIIKDPYGTVLNNFAGNTTGNGHYAPVNGTLFSYNSVIFGAYTLDVMATKYFDESATFATSSIIKEFFVFVPNNNHSKPICDVHSNEFCECPDGKEELCLIDNPDVCSCEYPMK